MKKVKIGLQLVMFTLIISTTSCKKENSADNGCSLTVQNIAGTYKTTSMRYKLNSTAAVQDFLALTDACEKDDIITFNSNGTFLQKDIGVVCVPNGDDSGKWSLTGKLLKAEGAEDAIVESFDCKTLVLYSVDVLTPGDKLTVTMVKQ